MYEARIVKLTEVNKHPNADRLLVAKAGGESVVVGLESYEGELVILFESDGQLSPEYCAANDLIGYTDPLTGERKGGYFGKQRRVRAQTLRGVKSEAYVATLDSVLFTGVDPKLLVEGFSFSELNGHPICNKYFTPATLKAQTQAANKLIKKQNPCFAKHVDTIQLRHLIAIPGDSVIYITEKLHGTSFRFGYVASDATESGGWLRRLFKKPRNNKEYCYLNGTRNVTMADPSHSGFYGDESFRFLATEPLKGKLHKGEVIYGELVGYTTTGAAIMGQHDTKLLRDKALTKIYGHNFEYSYGNTSPNCTAYCYRITQVNEDGYAVDLSWPQVKQRCGELGIEYVPEYATVLGIQYPLENLVKYVADMLEGHSVLDSKHPREGVVLRVESVLGTSWVKEKSFTFKVMEGIIKEQDSYVDLEESA